MAQVVLVDQTKEIDTSLLHAAAVSLDTQVKQDLSVHWTGISASVSSAPSVSAITPGAWVVFLVKTLPPGEGGFHLDRHNQPYAKVIASSNDDSWTIDASHEIIEMLVDPNGNRMQASQAIKISGNDVEDADGVFKYLVEACDPCEANEYAYDIGGIAVSDFITPHYYDSSATPGTLYSFKGNIKRPRQLLPGGYISYVQPDGQWNQILWVDPKEPPQYNNPKIADGVRSLRFEIHQAMGPQLDEAKHHQRRKRNGLPKAASARITTYREVRNDENREKRLHDWYGLK